METDTVVIALATGAASLALLVALAAHRRIASARKSLAMLQGTFEGRTLIEALAGYVGEVRALGEVLENLASRHRALSEKVSSSVRNLGVVRYDAFEDMGGQMSFSAALLDDRGDGVVVTAINGRAESRTYAKPVEGGKSEHNLSPEEEKAISEALSERPKVRRWRA